MKRRTPEEMNQMRIYVSTLLKKTEGDYKEAYNLYVEYMERVGSDEAYQVTYVKDISDFRKESEKFFIEQEENEKKRLNLKIDKTMLKKIYHLWKIERKQVKKVWFTYLYEDIINDTFSYKKYPLNFLRYAKKKLDRLN